MTHPQVRPDPAFGLLKLYDDALPHVYGYLLARCGDTGLAEDLTAESFLAAVHAVRKPGAPDPSIPWLIGVARHKLADHWRRVEREQRGLRLLDGEPARVDDPWETAIDRIRAREVLDRLGAHHRAALTLRYLDGLPVPEVARHLDRTLHATEGLLVRARRSGASVEREPADQPYGRGSVIVDPFGHRWMLLRRPARATGLRQGDVANVTMVARDAHRAKEFYEAVLRVPFSSGHHGTWRTDQTRPPLGIWSSEGAEPEVQLSYRVDDIGAAVERVRAAGGNADEPERKPYGLLAECVDDQGAAFRLWQPADRPKR